MVMRMPGILARLFRHRIFFPVHFIYALLACIYVFSIGWIFCRNRLLILDICRHFNFFKVWRMRKQSSAAIVRDAELKKRLENEQFARYAMYLDLFDFIQTEARRAAPGIPAIIEFGGSNGIIRLMFDGFPYEIADNFPVVDVQDLSHFKPDHYDFIVLDQILEHVCDPARALREAHRLLKKGGWLIVTVPFLVKIHYVPKDYWRFTQDGLRQLLSNYSNVTVKSWGNKDVVIDHIKTGSWPSVKEAKELGIFNLENDEELPHVVWGFARK